MATKKDIAAIVSRALPYIDTNDIRYTIEAMGHYLAQMLIRGERIEIRGFGSFSIRKRKYANKDAHYNTIYYRMSKSLSKQFNRHHITASDA
jgi:nucleoid DNA-binding protein